MVCVGLSFFEKIALKIASALMAEEHEKCQGQTSGTKFETVNVDFSISERQTSLNMQLWKDYADAVRIRLRAPSGIEYSLSDKGKD